MSLKDNALRIINEYGAAASLARNSSTYDPVTGDLSADTSETFNTHAIVESDERTISAQLGSATTFSRVYIVDSSVEPLEGDVLTVGAESFRVTRVSAVRGKQGVALAYYVGAVK